MAIDGKTLRGSSRLDAKSVHVLAAFATELGAAIGEMVVKPDQNEIAAAVVLPGEVRNRLFRLAVR